MALPSPTITRMQAPPFDPYHKWLGIPPAEQPPTYYRLLGLSALEHDGDVIQNAADARMAMLRSVQNGPHFKLSQELQSEISVARSCLLNPEFKRRYDVAIAGGTAAPAPPPHATPVAHETPPAIPALSVVRDVPPRRLVSRPRFRGRPATKRGRVKRDYPAVQLVKIIGGAIIGLIIGYYIAFRLTGFDPLEVMAR